MKKYYLVFATLSAFLISFGASSWPENGIVTLKMIFDGEVTLAELVEHEVPLDRLIEDFKNDATLTPKEKKTFMGKFKKKIKDLKAQEVKEIRAYKRRDKTTKNKHFYGEPELAEDATVEMLQQYPKVLAALKDQVRAGRINDSTYRACLSTIESLIFFHKNNRQICLEFSLNTDSATYGNRVSLHPAERDVPFHLKAGLMHSWLISYSEFALKHGLLHAMFTDGLSKNNGCLEARFRALCEWNRRMALHVKSVEDLSPNSKANKLPKTAKDAVCGYIESNFESISKETDLYSFEKVAGDIVEHFEGKIDSSGRSITLDDALTALELVFIRDSPVRKTPPKKSLQKPPSSAARKLLFAEEDTLRANRASLNDIETVLTKDGHRQRCKLIPKKGDGNCGFYALGSVTREQFIARVLEENIEATTPRIRELIFAAMREVGANTVEAWAAEFVDPSNWMGEITMELYARLYDMRVEVHALDHEENIFTHIMTVNPEGANEANIVHVNLAPIENEEQLSLNHYDRLRIARNIEPEVVAPLTVEDLEAEIDFGIVDRTKMGAFFGFGSK